MTREHGSWGSTREEVRSRIARRLAARDESGAVLILALVFLIVAAFALVGLVVFSGSAIMNTANLKRQRGLEYAAGSATQIAIQAVRYRPGAYTGLLGTPTPTPQSCLGTTRVAFSPTGHPTTHPTTSRTVEMSVDCLGEQTFPGSVTLPTVSLGPGTTITTTTLFGSATTTFVGYAISDTAHVIPATTTVTFQDLTTGTVTLSQAIIGSASADTLVLSPLFERKVTFFACQPSSATPVCSASNFLVRATVEFNDLSLATPTHPDLCGGGSTPSTSTCGTSMRITKWVVSGANH